jgi:hypothetical protein
MAGAKIAEIMKISGFTIARNAIKHKYPIKESILSILPICDEFIVNLGDSEDDTRKLIESIKSHKIKIFPHKWDLYYKQDICAGDRVLAAETDNALKECKGDWAFYLQSDEVIHQKDLPKLYRYMKKHLNNESVDGFKLRWLHFYESFYRYRIDRGWFQKQVRIIRNNNAIKAMEGAWGFEKKDKSELRVIKTPCFLYHYGWINHTRGVDERIESDAKIVSIENETPNNRKFKHIDKLPIYFGTHPAVMDEIIAKHLTSKKDFSLIRKKYFWSPLLWFRIRYKTGKRIKAILPK